MEETPLYITLSALCTPSQSVWVAEILARAAVALGLNGAQPTLTIVQPDSEESSSFGLEFNSDDTAD